MLVLHVCLSICMSVCYHSSGNIIPFFTHKKVCTTFPDTWILEKSLVQKVREWKSQYANNHLLTYHDHISPILNNVGVLAGIYTINLTGIKIGGLPSRSSWWI